MINGGEIADFFKNIFGVNSSTTIMLLLFTFIIIIYSVFVFYFYKYLARKNLFHLNLQQYNKESQKYLAFIFYILEYIVILPILTIFWFGIFSILLLFMAKTLDVKTILLISAAVIAGVRVSSYINQELSQELAKVIPFTLLAFALTQPEFFSVSLLIDRISQISSLISNISIYLIFIIIIEFIMRFGDLIGRMFKKTD